MESTQNIAARQYEITNQYLAELDKHLLDIVEGRTSKMLEINEIAQLLHIHPTHLSNTIRLATGHSACYFYEEKILDISKAMLEKNELSISAIAGILTYDPSNFTKFFKAYTNTTPKQYRELFLKTQREQNTVSLTKNTVSVTRA